MKEELSYHTHLSSDSSAVSVVVLNYLILQVQDPFIHHRTARYKHATQVFHQVWRHLAVHPASREVAVRRGEGGVGRWTLDVQGDLGEMGHLLLCCAMILVSSKEWKEENLV